MFRNRTFKVLSNLILLVVFCTGQVIAAPNNSANKIKIKPLFSNPSIIVNDTPPLAPEFTHQALMIAGDTIRASLDSSGVQGNNNSYLSSISADGRYLAFWSEATNLVSGDTNGVSDVFMRDMQTNTTMRVSLDSSGIQGNGESSTSLGFPPSISADGRYVAFFSFASNLVSGDTNDTVDVFVRDTQINTTTRVSLDSSGAQGNGPSSSPFISANGRYIVFTSDASNLVNGDTNGKHDVFVRDMQMNTTKRVSVDSSSIQGNSDSYSHPSISADGRYVAFQSLASNLVSGDTNTFADIFVRDTVANTTTRVSLNSSGVQGDNTSMDPSISADGRYLAFWSEATNLVSGDTNGWYDVFVRDTQTNTTTRVSADSSGMQGNGVSFAPSISANGRYVAFQSFASNLVSGDTNGTYDVFVRDTQMNTTTRVSADSSSVQGNGPSSSPFISANGNYIAFMSEASNLVSGDTNGMYDAFVHENSIVPIVQKPPLILIPGIGGSKLVNEDGELWPLLESAPCDPWDSKLNDLKLNHDGITDSVKSVTPDRILRSEHASCGILYSEDRDIYDTTITKFVNAGYQLGDINNYKPGDNLFTFPYDWRKDVEQTAIEQLLPFINNVLLKTGSDRVDIFAHSMGGLITRVALAQQESSGKIRKVLTLGTPVLGSPKTIALLVYKSMCFIDLPDQEVFDVKIDLGCLYNKNILQDVLTNFPSAYQILPSPNYDQAVVEAPLAINWDSNNDGKIDGPQSYDDWSYIVASHRNSDLMIASETFHNTYDNLSVQDSSVQYVAVVGIGVPTPMQIWEYKNLFRSIKYDVYWSPKGGDGTVPRTSASLFNPATSFDMRNGITIKSYDGVEHGNLAINPAVLSDAIAFYASTDNTYQNLSAQGMEALAETPSGPGTEIEIIGSAEGYIQDSSNNQSGQDETMGGLVNLNIPGSYYFNVGDTQSYYFENSDNYRVALTSTADSPSQVQVSNYQNDKIQQVASFNVSETTGANMSMDVGTGQDLSALQLNIDTNGDGTIDQTQSPFTVSNAPTDVTLSNSYVVNGKPSGTLLGTLSTTDPDAGDTFTYSLACAISGPDDSLFSITDNTLSTASSINSETKKNYVACVRSTDSGGLFFDKNFTITVVDESTFSSAAANDGWTLESSEYSSRANARNNSGTLLVGDNARNRQYRSLLYFDTASLPNNAVISSVTVKIKQEGVTGTDPFTTHLALLADMAKGFFGKSPLENTDFQAKGTPRPVGSFAPVSGEPDWYQLVLNPVNFKYVNLAGVTQFRLRFTKDDDNDKVADIISFYSGDDATNPPQLIVEYYVP